MSWFLPSLVVQKILWPEIGDIQGRVHATEKSENHENDGKSRFLSTFGPWNWSRVLATRIFKINMACRDGILQVILFCKFILHRPGGKLAKVWLLQKKKGEGRLIKDFSRSLRWILISSGRNVIKVCILVPATPQLLENLFAVDLAGPRSDSCNRKIRKSWKWRRKLICEHVWPLKLIKGSRYANL